MDSKRRYVHTLGPDSLDIFNSNEAKNLVQIRLHGRYSEIPHGAGNHQKVRHHQFVATRRARPIRHDLLRLGLPRARLIGEKADDALEKHSRRRIHCRVLLTRHHADLTAWQCLLELASVTRSKLPVFCF